MDFTTKEILFFAFSSTGAIGTLILLFNAISSQLTKRRERMENNKRSEIMNSVEYRRIENEREGKAEEILLKIIEGLKEDIAEKDKEIKAAEAAERFDRKTVMKIFELVGKMQAEIDRMNIMVLNDDETRFFMERYRNIKDLIIEVKTVLTGSE